MMKIDYGKIVLCDEMISYSSNSFGEWHLSLGDLKIVGEYTNQDGPYAEDHFLVLVDQNNKIFEVPISAEGLDDFLLSIHDKLDCRLDLKLNLHVDFASRVLFPVELNELPLFVLKEVRPSSVLGNFLSSFGFGKTEMSLNPRLLG